MIMAPDKFPPLHSCTYCQDFILSMTEDYSGDLDKRLSSRLKSWLTSEIGGGSMANNIPRDLSYGLLQSSLRKDFGSIIIFDCTIAEARASTIKGCRLCSFIIECIGDRIKRESEHKVFIAAFVTPDYTYFGALQVLSRNGVKIFEVFSSVRFEFELITLTDNNASTEISGRPVDTQPSSKESLSLAQTWLHKCSDKHQTCLKQNRGFMPTRIIEIVRREGRMCLRLCDTDPQTSEPYLALSYCWGGEQRIKTTKETLLRHRTRIDMQDLPATIRDTVIVAESLGVPKIWVDAFCIIQDDPIDKASEIAQMPLIYSQATVTLVASRASGVEEGFLRDRKRTADDTPDLVFQLPFRTRKNQLGSVVLIPRSQKINQEPLALRAWALQEQFLSPRILEYGTLQTSWICHNAYWTDYPPDDCLPNNRYSEQNSSYNLRDSILPRYCQFGDLRVTWYRLISTYSSLFLTICTDRLPAISGIAAEFSKILDDDYKAGLWASTMERELLWTRIAETAHSLRRRPSEYQAPSWSWAALNVPIKINSDAVKDKEIFVVVVGCKIKTLPNRNRSVYESYGAVESGTLKLRGRLQSANWTRYCSSSLRYNVLRKRDGTGLQGTIPTDMVPDALEPEHITGSASTIPVFLLKISGPDVKGLVLRQHSSGIYSRLGVFNFNKSYTDSCVDGLTEESDDRADYFQECLDWLESSPWQIITII